MSNELEFTSKKKKVRLIAIVTGRVLFLDRMNNLRTQWHKSVERYGKEDDIELVFVIGRRDAQGNKMTRSQMREVHRLSRQYGDIVIADVKDWDLGGWDYCQVPEESSTTMKVLWAIKYAVEHYEFDYLVRLGDDAYFRVDYYLNEIVDTLPKTRLLHGHFWGPGACDNVLDGVKYKYVLGMGYVMSRDVAEYVAEMPWEYVNLEAPEDMVVSKWLLPLNLNRVHDIRFHNVKKRPLTQPNHYGFHAWKECDKNDILYHYVDGDMWNHIDEDGILHCNYSCHDHGDWCKVSPPPGHVDFDRDGLDMAFYLKNELHVSINSPDSVQGHWCRESQSSDVPEFLKKTCRPSRLSNIVNL